MSTSATKPTVVEAAHSYLRIVDDSGTRWVPKIDIHNKAFSGDATARQLLVDGERVFAAQLAACKSHTANKTRDEGYSGSVNARRPNPSARGWITTVETCTCGAERRTNHNGQHAERGAWS